MLSRSVLRDLVARAEPVFRMYLAVSGFALNWIAIGMFCVMLGSNAWNILLRTVTGQGIMWHQEISLMAAFWVYFAAYGLLGKEDAFIRVEALYRLLGPRARVVALVAVRLLTIGFHGVLLWLCVKNLKIVSIYITPILEWPEVIYYVPLLVGTADIVLTETIHVLRLLANQDAERGPRPSITASA